MISSHEVLRSKAVLETKDNALTPHIYTELREVVLNPALTSLLQTFGYNPSREKDCCLENVIAMRRQFTNTYWNFRNNAERSPTNQLSFSKDKTAKILHTAEALGMVEEKLPQKSRYGAIIILGAVGQALARTQFAKSRSVDAPVIAALTAENPLPLEKKHIWEEYAPDAKTEFDLMDASLRQV